MIRRFTIACLLITLPAFAQTIPPKKNEKVELLHPYDLVVGPIEAEVDWMLTERGRQTKYPDDKVLLHVLTKSQLAFRRFENGKVQERVWATTNERELRDSETKLEATFVRVKLPNGLKEWKWDQKKREYVGPDPLPPLQPQFKESAVPAKLVPQYLAMAAEGLQCRLNVALQKQDAEQVKWLLRRADALTAAGERAGGSVLAGLFDLSGYAERQAKRLTLEGECEKELKKVELDEAEVRKYIQATAKKDRDGIVSTASNLGVAAALKDEDKFVSAISTIQTNQYDLMRQAAEQEARELERSRVRQKFLTDTQRKKIDALEAEYAAEKRAITAKLEAGWKVVGLDPRAYRRLDVLSGEVYGGADRTGAAKELEAREKTMKSVGLVEPVAFEAYLFLTADAVLTPAATPAKQRENAEAVFQLAVAATDAVARIPADPVFGSDRAYLLHAIAKLIHRAAAYAASPSANGNGPKGWSKAFDPRADYGVRLCDRALKEAGGESGDFRAEIRATRVWLLFQRGLFAVAYDLGMKDVDDSLVDNAYAQVQIARISAFMTKTENEKRVEEVTRNKDKGSPELKKYTEAAGLLARGLRAGYRNLSEIDTDPDFEWAKGEKGAGLDWGHYAQPKLNVVARKEAAGGGLVTFGFEIRNTGTVPLVDAKFVLRNGTKNVSEPYGVTYLAPGGVTRWYPSECKVDDFRKLQLHVNNDRKGVGGRSTTVVKGISLDTEQFTRYIYGGR